MGPEDATAARCDVRVTVIATDASTESVRAIRRYDAGGVCINIDYAIHGTRGPTARVSLANQRELSSINAQ